MNVLGVYLRIYGECLQKALLGIRKNVWTLILPIALSLVLLGVLGPVLGSLGMVGGILFGLAVNAALSCYLYFTGEVVAHAKVSLQEFTKSIGAYFWSLMNLFFVFWIARLVLGLLAVTPALAGIINLGVNLLIAVVLNSAPEVIYHRGTYGGLETISRTIQFMQENWLEWLIPSAAGIGLVYLFITYSLSALGALGFWLQLVLLGAFVHVLMVFRGHLFSILNGSTHRQRMFRFRKGV